MQLPEQLLKKLRLLTDKPISPTVNKQLHPLLLQQNLSIEKAIPLLYLKKRCDLLIHVLQNNRYPVESTINSMLVSIQTNILQYKIAEVLQLYILVLSKIDEDKKLLEIGYYDIVKLAIKQPNLEMKQKLFQCIVSNCEYFYKRKSKKVIMAIVANYVDVFTKFLIYVPSFVSMISMAIEIDSNCKKIINKDHPEREANLQQIFIDLSSKQLGMISNQIITILQNTKDKLNYYSLHRNCLDALKKIGDILNDFKIKESEINFTQLTVGQIYRTIQIFQDRKGTLDEARFAKSVWNKRVNELRKIKQQKTQKYINPPQSSQLILDSKQADKPLLIQQVISMANNYRLKYQVSPAENQQVHESRIVSVQNNFLKKGIGVGGGRTYLLNEKHRSVFAGEKIKNKRLYDDIVNKCFSQYDKDLEYKSFVDPKLINPNATVVSAYQQQQAEWKVVEPERLERQRNQLDIEQINSLAIFDEPRKQKKGKEKHQRQISVSFDDEQVEQINNLIELAYSYKFS